MSPETFDRVACVGAELREVVVGGIPPSPGGSVDPSYVLGCIRLQPSQVVQLLFVYLLLILRGKERK